MRTLALLLLLLNVLFFVWAKSWLLWLPWQPVQFIQPIQTYHANTQHPTLHLVEEATLDVAPLVTPLTLNDPTNLLATLDKLDAAKSIANEKENDIEEIIVEAPQADIDEVVADLLKANEEADEIDNVVSQDIIADESVRKTTEQVNEIVNAEIEADNDNTEKNTTAEVEAINEVAAAQFKDDPYSALLSLAGTTPLAVKNDNESQPTTMTGQIATEKTMMLVETAAETNQPAESSEPPLQTQTIVCYDVGAFVQSTSAQNAKQWFTQKNITGLGCNPMNLLTLKRVRKVEGRR